MKKRPTVWICEVSYHGGGCTGHTTAATFTGAGARGKARAWLAGKHRDFGEGRKLYGMDHPRFANFSNVESTYSIVRVYGDEVFPTHRG